MGRRSRRRCGHRPAAAAQVGRAGDISPAIPERARQLAAELERRFARDAELATQLDDAQRRLRDANDRLWSGLHPDGIAAIYGEHPAAVEAATARSRSEILDASDPLSEAQRAHWTIDRALGDYQDGAERRRQLAAEFGELVGALIASLVAAGWSEHDAKEANILNLICAGD